MLKACLLIAGLFICLPQEALAQCTGVFGANQVCGSLVGGVAKPINSSSFPAGLTVGTTPITGGASTGVLYNNSGILGADAGLTWIPGGPLTINPTGSNGAITAQFFDAPYGINILNIPAGAPGNYNAPSAIAGTNRYGPTGDSSDNPDGIYGILWYTSAHNFTGGGAAIRGNVYTVPVIVATIASGGTNNQVGDVLTIVGGTCNTLLNTPPTFAVSAVSGGAVTAVTYQNQSACTVYPSNPVSTTSSRGGATPPTLNLTVTGPNVTNLIGMYGRARHTSPGTVTDAVSIYSDGCYNAGGGTLTNCKSVWLQPPYTASANSYGLWFNGSYGTQGLATNGGASIGVASGSNLTVQLAGVGVGMFLAGGYFQVTGDLTNQFVAAGGLNKRAAYAAGRATNEAYFGVAGVANDFFTGTAGGDTVLASNTNLWIAANLAGMPVAAINIDQTNGKVTIFSGLGIGGSVQTTGLRVTNAFVNPSANGQAEVGASSTVGAMFGGQGSVSDFALVNKTGTTVCSAATGGTTINCVTLTLTNPLAVASGGTNCAAASGTCLDNLTGFASTGVISRTGAGAYSFLTITGTANQITVTNGDGVSGNPSLALAGPHNVTTLTSNGVLYGNGTSPIQATAQGGTNTVLAANAGAPAFTAALALNTSLAVPIIGPLSDSTTALKITKADLSTAIVTVDTTNKRIGINKTPGAVDLDVNGAVNMASTLTVANTVTISTGANNPLNVVANGSFFSTFQCGNAASCNTGFTLASLDGSSVNRNAGFYANGGVAIVFQTQVNGVIQFGKDNGSGGLTQQAYISNAGGFSVGTTTDPGAGAILANTSVKATTYVESGTKLRASGTAPALTSCGTSPTIEGSDLSGTVTMGTGSPTGCVITFNAAYTGAPRCTVSWRVNIASMQYAVSTTAITLTQTATSSNVVDYICTVRSGGWLLKRDLDPASNDNTPAFMDQAA